MIISGLKNRNALKENPFLGTDYEALWENNPYAGLYYEPTFWDKIGLSNKSKDANAEYDRLYAEYIAGLYDQQRQDEYNSPASEAQRMREAGLNPDLQGLSGASNTDEMNSPNAGPNPALNGQSPAVGTLQRFSSILSFALNAYQGITSTLNMKDAQNIRNISDLTNMAKPYVTQSFAEAFLNGLDLHTAVSSGSTSFSRQFNKRVERDALKAFENLFYSSDFGLQRQALDNVNKFSNDKIRFDATQLFMNNEKQVSDFVKEMVDLSLEEYKLSKKSNISFKSKEKMLNDFRMKSIERLRDDYKKSNGHDILSGLLLAGMLESSGVSLLSKPGAYGIVGGQRAVNDLVGFGKRAYNSVKGILGF